MREEFFSPRTKIKFHGKIKNSTKKDLCRCYNLIFLSSIIIETLVAIAAYDEIKQISATGIFSAEKNI